MNNGTVSRFNRFHFETESFATNDEAFETDGEKKESEIGEDNSSVYEREFVPGKSVCTFLEKVQQIFLDVISGSPVDNIKLDEDNVSIFDKFYIFLSQENSP